MVGRAVLVMISVTLLLAVIALGSAAPPTASGSATPPAASSIALTPAGFGSPTPPPGDEGGGGQACTPDGGGHYAYMILSYNQSWILGYQILYTSNYSWALGDQSNEFTFKHDLAAPHWASPDWGPPDTWINRGEMPDLPRPQERFEIEAIFDRPNADDPRCSLVWNNF